MLLVLLLLVVSVSGQEQSFGDFMKNNEDKSTKRPIIDYSSLKACWMYGATNVELVDSSHPEMGHKCTVLLDTWTNDDVQSKELCESRFPYYIIGAHYEKDKGTRCTFQINLFCETSYTQIHGKCYRVFDAQYTLEDAHKTCKKGPTGTDHKIAQYYSTNMRLYLDQIDRIDDAWVTVPEVKDYFPNGMSNEVVYVQDGAFKYDVAKGSIILDNPESKHQVLCEYTPPMTMAEMFYIANIYSEIYPISVHNGGAVIPSSSFMTLKQASFVENTQISTFDPTPLNDVCMNIGRILNVESFPMTAIKEEFEDIQSYLSKHHKFYLTNAFKNDGCSKGHFIQMGENKKSYQIFPVDPTKNNIYCDTHSLLLHKMDRFPSKPGMRAPLLCTLHTFKWEYGDCEPGPSWSAPVISFDRPDRRFCHYIDNNKIFNLEDAIKRCSDFGASLSGFDSDEEFTEVKNKLAPVMSSSQHRSAGTHFRLGARTPCEQNCQNPNGGTYKASWDTGVAVNNAFLNKNDGGYDSSPDRKEYISFRSDWLVFHSHPRGTYEVIYLVCGKSAPLMRADRQKAKLSG